MNIRFLETVVWLAELRNFRATADRMKITPAAISNRIAAIEQELGFKLFERDTRDVRLTHQGEVFLVGARDIVMRYDALIASVTPEKTLTGVVRLGILPSMALTILPGVIETLRQRFPSVSVSITTDSSANLVAMLERRDLDVIFGFPGEDVSHLHVVNLCTFGMFWVAKGDVPQQAGPLRKDDLTMWPIISYEIGTLNHRRLEQYLSPALLSRSVIHYSNSLGTTISMVSAGIGIAVLPPIVVQHELRSGALQVLNVHPSFPATDYHAFYNEHSTPNLAPLVSKIAVEVAEQFCSLYDDALAYRSDS